MEKFRERTAYGLSTADCFPPWYLHQTYKLSEEEAMRQSSEKHEGSRGCRGYDFGIDAYYLNLSGSKPELTLIQAKYSDSLRYISEGFKELEKYLPQIQMILDSGVSGESVENKVLVNLRSALKRLDPEARRKLDLDLVVIHLCDEDHEIISNRSKTSREELKEVARDSFLERICTIRDIGPREMGPQQEIAAPSPWMSLSLTSNPIPVSIDRGTMYFGIGFLAELVELYRERRHALFSKNVRYYLTKKDNVEKGAAGKMRETLKEICHPRKQEETLAPLPEIFALYHNGVTMYSHDIDPGERTIRIRDPYVLNGCQTIMNAYLYSIDQRHKIEEGNWKRVLVPLRILSTKEDELVRAVTINNNRQNAIRYDALRANDPVQIQLEERFKKKMIFYERQEGAYKSLVDSSPDTVEDEYTNSLEGPVRIVDLARSVAAASGKTGWARHPKDLFESDRAYGQVFSQKHLMSITLLTFLQNLHDVIPLVLKKDLKLQQYGNGPKPGSLGYYSLCLLIRYLAKKNDCRFIREFGSRTWSRKTQFRKQVKRLLGNREAKIRNALKEKFLPLDDSETESLNDAFTRAEASLRLKSEIDPYEIFKNLDNMT